MGTANHSNWQLRRKATPYWVVKPLPKPRPVDPLDRDIRTLADHCMTDTEIAAHYGMTETEVRAALRKTTRVRRVM